MSVTNLYEGQIHAALSAYGAAEEQNSQEMIVTGEGASASEPAVTQSNLPTTLAYAVDSVGIEIDVDLSSMTAEIQRDGKVVRSWTVGVGAADTPTPTGRYSVTDTLDNTFNPVYGCCILPITATQPNLPAGWSGGNRMAIHGTTAPLGQANSTGCVRSGEEDLRYLMSEVPLGTPVTISN